MIKHIDIKPKRKKSRRKKRRRKRKRGRRMEERKRKKKKSNLYHYHRVIASFNIVVKMISRLFFLFQIGNTLNMQIFWEFGGN